MLFQSEHIEQIKRGEKTETRRDWKRPQVREGGSYRATTHMLTPREEAPAFITVTDVHRERLGELDAAAADREGGYSVAEFRDLWRDLHGEWDPSIEVYVIRFEGHATDPERNGGGG